MSENIPHRHELPPEPDAIACKCSVCGEWQRWTPSGMTCHNGHGGAPGKNVRVFSQDSNAIRDLDRALTLLYEIYCFSAFVPDNKELSSISKDIDAFLKDVNRPNSKGADA